MYNFITIMYDVFSCLVFWLKTRIAVTSEILKIFPHINIHWATCLMN